MKKIDRSFLIPHSQFPPDHIPRIGTDPEVWLCVADSTLYVWNRQTRAWGASGSVESDSAALPYLSYVAILDQTGSNAPVATVVANELDGTVVWARLTDGVYTGTLAGVFTADKTVCFISGIPGNTGVAGGARRFSNDVVRVLTPNDGDLTSFSIEIRVYS